MSSKSLPVPAYSQLDNLNKPHQTCSYTSLAMVLEYFDKDSHKLDALDGGQLEDEMSRYAEDVMGLQRGNPSHMELLINEVYGPIVGIKAHFDPYGSRAKIKGAIDSGSPCVLHGYFTPSGHVLVVIGYDDEAYGGAGAYIVQDPYGECDLSVPTYEGMPTKVGPHRYSYRRVEELCVVADTFWVHTYKRTT